jgi:nitroreductase
MEHNNIIRQRRSIYTSMFNDEPVDDKIIEEMLENARWAPTHRLTEPWRFVVFKGAGLRKLGEYQAQRYQLKHKGDAFDEQTMNKLLSKPQECSHIIAIGMHRDEGKSVPEIEEICSVACAVQNMLLTASAHRIGCYWSTGGITYYEGIQEFFQWGAKDRLMGFLYIGTPRTTKWPEGKRSSLENKVRWQE